MAATVRPEVDPSKIKKEKEDSDLRCEKSDREVILVARAGSATFTSSGRKSRLND